MGFYLTTGENKSWYCAEIHGRGYTETHKTLGHKENSDHLEGSLGHSQTEGPWEREKEITCSNDESSKQRFDKKKGGRKKSKQQQGKGASKKKKYCHRAYENSSQKIKKT